MPIKAQRAATRSMIKIKGIVGNSLIQTKKVRDSCAFCKQASSACLYYFNLSEMHILKIIHGYPPNFNAGSEVYSQSICTELSKHHRVSVFTREENPYATYFSIREQKVNDSLMLYFVNNPQAKDGYRHKQMDENFTELIKEIKPDVAHIGI